MSSAHQTDAGTRKNLATHAAEFSMFTTNPAPDVRTLALHEMRRRQLRHGRFDANISQDTVWNMLLELTVAERECRPVAVKCLQVASCAPASSALRWIAYLERSGSIEIDIDHRDRRRRCVRLTPELRQRIEHYLLEAERRCWPDHSEKGPK